MRSLALILAFGAFSYWMCDVRSPSAIRSVLFPFLFVLSLVALALWIFIRLRRHEQRDSGWEIDLPSVSGDGSPGD